MKESKLKTASILSLLGLGAAIGGIFYGVKKGYGGVGVTATMFLFGLPFIGAATYIGKQAEKQIV